MDIAVRVVIPGLAHHGAHRVYVTEKTRQYSRRRDSVTLSEAAGVVAGGFAGEDIYEKVWLFGSSDCRSQSLALPTVAPNRHQSW